MFTRIISMILLLATLAHADIVCNGSSDYLENTALMGQVMSNSTGTWLVTYRPTGTPDFGTNCDEGELIFGQIDYAMGLYRHGNQGGVHTACGFNYDGSVTSVNAPHTTDTWTQIAFVHTGGNISIFKDGVSIASTGSGNTELVSSVLRLCRNNNSYSFTFGGIIASAQTFSTALSANVIAAIGKSRLHRVAPVAPSGSWSLHSCADGANCNTQTFLDSSGNNRTFTASGVTGKASEYMSYPWGVE
jgi:Concanavalin A-like lectin/glucanases superfamily